MMDDGLHASGATRPFRSRHPETLGEDLPAATKAVASEASRHQSELDGSTGQRQVSQMAVISAMDAAGGTVARGAHRDLHTRRCRYDQDAVRRLLMIYGKPGRDEG
ncbi:hypothetical protein Sa4125_15230 [Aureimonas sp. SA4125]|nr:hypothetical protein Sa4125_15230 [Aureimonas sp. SA4125]